MSVDGALTATELTALEGPTTVRRFLSVVPNTVVATAEIAALPSGYEIASCTTTDESADWSDVRAGMTFRLESSLGVFKGLYRVRKAPSGSTFYFMETGLPDSGLFPINLRNVAWAVGDVITVYNRYDLWTVLPRIVYPGTGLTATIYEDYDESVGTNNTTPENIVNIEARDSRGNHGRHISTLVTGTDDIMIFTALALKWGTSSGSSVSYAWTVPGSWTNVSGEDTAALMATVPVGYHQLLLTVTDTISGTVQRIVNVWVHHETDYPPIRIAAIGSDQEDRTGRRITFTLNDQALADIPDGAMVNYWEDCTWNGASPYAHTFTTQCPGWFLRYQFSAEKGLVEAAPELVGPAGILNLLGGYSQYFERVSSPANWQQVAPLVATLHFCIFYLMRHRAANVLKLFNYQPLDMNSSSALMPVFKVNGATLLQQLQNLAKAYFNANFGADSNGNLWHRIHPSLLIYDADRTALPERCTLTPARCESLSGTRELKPKVRKVRGEAFYNNGSAALPTPFLADAPSAAPGQGASDQTLEGIITDAGQSDISLLTGNQYALENNPYPEIRLKIPKNWPVFSPSHMVWVRVNMDAAYMPDNVAFNKRCVPIRITRSHTEDGVDTTIELEAETQGLSGVAVPVPVAKPNTYVAPYFPPATTPPPAQPDPPEQPSIPGEGGEMLTDGSFVVGCTEEGEVHRTFNFKDSPPTWEDISPTGGASEMKMVLPDPATNYNRGCYALGYGDPDTYLYHTTNVGADTVTWVEGGDTPGEYTKLVAFKGIAGTAAIYGPEVSGGGGTGTVTVNFDGTGYSSYTISVGHQTTGGYSSPNCAMSAYPHPNRTVEVTITLPNDKSVTEVGCVAKLDWGSLSTWPIFDLYDVDDNLLSTKTNPALHTSSWRSTSVGGFTQTGVRKIIVHMNGSDGLGISALLDDIYWITSTPDPVTAFVNTTDDYGASYNGTILVGSSPGGIGGFDGARLGPATLAAALSQVKRATTIGGAYSNQTGAAETATCIEVPWYRIGSVSYLNNGTEPDFFMGGSFGLYKVIAGVATDITPVVGGTVAVANAVTTWKGRWIACLCDDGTDRNLYISTDTGATWTLIGGADGCADARSVRVRRLASTPGQLVIACGSNGILYWPGTGGLVDKSAPTGTFVNAEFWG